MIFLHGIVDICYDGTVGAVLSVRTNLCLQCTSVLVTHDVFTRSLELLSSQQNMRIVFNALEGNYALCLLANVIQLAYIQREDVLKDVAFPTFTVSKCKFVLLSTAPVYSI
jgi:ubiquitin-protein ligase E3 B